MAELTPMMQQYMETKKQYPDCILFYRLGDFYEMFFEDALTASRAVSYTHLDVYKRQSSGTVRNTNWRKKFWFMLLTGMRCLPMI